MTARTMDAAEQIERQRVAYLMAHASRPVFVFGSNREGIHGAGAAKIASQQYGAVRGIGEGLCGQSYALPTKLTWRQALTFDEVQKAAARFLAFAAAHPERTFVVTRVGCGFAGFTDDEMAPLFADAPANCELPTGWRAEHCQHCDASGSVGDGARCGACDGRGFTEPMP